MTGETTPPTQWATCPLVTLRIGFGVVLAGGGGIAAGGDAVPDGDLPGADEDVLDEQPQHPLAFSDGGGVGVAVQLGEEAFQVVGELEVGLAVGCLCIESVDLPAQVRLPRAFPARAASLVPGLLAATRTGLTPAGDDELTNTKSHHGCTSRCHLPLC